MWFFHQHNAVTYWLHAPQSIQPTASLSISGGSSSGGSSSSGGVPEVYKELWPGPQLCSNCQNMNYNQSPSTQISSTTLKYDPNAFDTTAARAYLFSAYSLKTAYE